MKTLIVGAGPLGSLYAYLFHKSGKNVTILARNEHYEFLKKNGIVLYNEFTQEKIIGKIDVVNNLSEEDIYDLVIVIMRKNSVKKVLPLLSKSQHIKNFLFMGNNTMGFGEYVKYLPQEKVLFGFPGGGGSRINHIVHYIDSRKPGGRRLPVVIGEMDGKIRQRTKNIRDLFESSGVPVRLVDDMDSWLKYHVAFVLPIGGALLKSGDNYKLARDHETIRMYIRAVKEAGRVLKALGYKKSYNVKLNSFYWLPEGWLIKILKKLFNSKFAEVAMMMHVNAARDEMIELGNELGKLKGQTTVPTPNLDELIPAIQVN